MNSDYGLWGTAKDKGSALEEQVAAYLVAQGYAVETNVVIVGRTGGRHEIDVLATKADGLIEFRVMVECKNYSGSVSKDVVAKVKMVRDDCSFDKAIIACPSGFALGAHQQAKDLGVDLWDQVPNESREKSRINGLGFRSNTSKSEAQSWVAESARAFGSRETIAGVYRAYVECCLFELDYTIRTRTLFSAKEHIVREWKSYEMLSARVLHTFSDFPELEPIKAKRVIRASVAPGTLRRSLEKHFTDFKKKSSASDIQEGKRFLKNLGIRPDAEAMKIVNSTALLLPVIVGVLESTQGSRVVVYDELMEEESANLSAAVTRNLAALTSVLSG